MSTPKCKIVIGSLFGDEGKGKTTDYLSAVGTYPSLVIRFSGGHQAGHTVIRNGKKHIFAQLGSGTLNGSHTYWTKQCTFSPVEFVKEYKGLVDLGITQKPYNINIHALAPVTTYFDVFYNRANATFLAHGTCGLGFGSTIERNENNVNLHVQDLMFPAIIEKKLDAIYNYYAMKVGDPAVFKAYYSFDFKKAKQEFLQAVEICFHSLNRMCDIVYDDTKLLGEYSNFVFEGSQGIMLDMDHGIFPNVTRSNTTSKNAIAFIKEKGLPAPEIYYVTRAYTSRHGNGWMPNDGMSIALVNNKDEINVFNDWQRNFRVSPLDMDTLNYALQCDNNYSSGLVKHLVVTCVDQVEDFFATVGGAKCRPFPDKLQDFFLTHLHQEFKNVYTSNGPSSEHMKVQHFEHAI
jgi:adenylosuccinate synthase